MPLVLACLGLAAPAWVADIERAMATAGVPASDKVVAFAPTPAIDSFARQATASAKDGGARARKLYDAILALKHQGAIAADRDNTPKARPPKTAAQVWEAAQGGGDRKAGCYELAALYVAAARSVGLDALGVERDEPEGTGQIGHIMAAVRTDASRAPAIFDLQNESIGTRFTVRALSDLEMAAHHYNHLAVAAFLHADLREAQHAIDLALALAPASPSFHNNRATVLASRGELDVALAEALHAVELAPDVPLFRYQAGRLYLATGAVSAAIGSLSDALALRPGYGVAQRDRGWAYLLAGDAHAAERDLKAALGAAGDTPDGDLYLALFLAAQERRDEARAAVSAGLAKHRGDARLHALQRLLTDGESPDVQGKRLREVLDSVARARSAAVALP